MEVSPKTLREVEFREKMRGYHPEDVDHFLEQVAAGIEVLQDRLRQAVDRAQRAEAAASEAGGADDSLRKTLVLAQRTADMAIQEAREQAARILASAEQQAQAILTEAEDRGRRTLEETVAEARAELTRLESHRSQAQQDVETLQRWLEEHKAHLQASLADALSAVERAGVLWPAPSTRSADPGPRRSTSSGAQALAGATAAGGGRPADVQESTNGRDSDPAQETMMWTPTAEERDDLEVAGEDEEDPVMSGSRRAADAEEQALDDFFDDREDFDDERRFGNRLRRRR